MGVLRKTGRQNCWRLGFTPVEIVIAIAILAVLAVLSVSRFISFTSEARIAVRVVAGAGMPVAGAGGMNLVINYNAGPNSGFTENWAASANPATLCYGSNCTLTYNQTTGSTTIVTNGC